MFRRGVIELSSGAVIRGRPQRDSTSTEHSPATCEHRMEARPEDRPNGTVSGRGRHPARPLPGRTALTAMSELRQRSSGRAGRVDGMHTVPGLKVLYFGTPVVLISSRNEDGSANI